MSDPLDLARAVIVWLATHPDITSALLAAVLGSGHALRSYRRSGRLPLSDLPWISIRRLWFAIRREYWAHPKPPDNELAVIDADIEHVRTRLGRNSYEPGWPLSLYYKGEDINARRYVYAPGREYPHRQVHIRGWDRGDGTVELNAHEEPSALHHPRAHIRSRDMTDATDWVAFWFDTDGPLDPAEFVS